MKYEINDVIELIDDLPKEGIKKGAVGVIVDIFQTPYIAYEVEFTNDKGETIAEVVLLTEQMKKI